MKRLVLVIACFIQLIAHGQILDTSHNHNYQGVEAFIVTQDPLVWFNEDSTAVDTSLFGFEASYPATENKNPFLDLGYEGSPYLDLAALEVPGLALDLGVPSLKKHFFNHRINRIHTERPFTRLNYSQGDNELVFIEAQHAQHISKRLTLGVDYRRLKNHNFYYYNISNAENVRFANLFNTKLYTGYYNKDRSYEMLVAYTWNKSSNIETGGLQDTDDFESLTGRSKLNNNAVLLSDAKTILANHNFSLVQFFRFGKAELDSTTTPNLTHYSKQIVWETSYNTTRLEYIDKSPDSAYYGAALLAIHDSTQHNRFRNDLSFVFPVWSFPVRIGAELDLDRIYMDSAARLLFGVKPYIQLRGGSPSWQHQLLLKTGLSGYNQGDINLSYGAEFKAIASIGLAINQQQAFYLDQTFASTMANWDLGLNRVKQIILDVEGKRQIAPKMTVNATFHGSTNSGLVYYDSSLIPQQFNGSISYIRFSSGANYHGKRFGFVVNASFQHTSNRVVLPRPQWMAKTSLYANINLFKKNLKTQWGVSSYWFSDFNAPKYDPVTSRWINQVTSFSMYPPIQVFINAKVKSFNFGILARHAQEGLMGEQYYSSPSYPILPRVIRLNIRWDLPN